MSKEIKARWGWLKAMHIYTIAGAGGFGLAIIFATYIIGDLIAIPFFYIFAKKLEPAPIC